MHYISYTARKPVKKGKAEKMIKGINKQIIEIKCTNDEYFDKVLLFVRADKADTPQGLLKKNAENFCGRIMPSYFSRALSRRTAIKLALLSITLAGSMAALIWLAGRVFM